MRQPHGGWMNVDTVVDNAEEHFSGRYGITRRQIERTLHLLFETFASSHGSLGGATRMNLVQQLLSHIQTEAQNHIWALKDFRFVRHAFIILTYLALQFDSDLLARALRTFWSQAEPIVSQYEQPHHGEEWYGTAAKIEQLSDPNPYAAWPRNGASRNLDLPWPRHRARSAPAVRHRHNHSEVRLTIPTFTTSAWASPIISPVPFPTVDYLDELENMQYQQQEMSMKLDNVDEKLDLLMTGFF
ncbi:hypothetical protein PTMSG1_03987 [Pyrenophora teres f. maculata]|nr:hypothetical protein PTMSG1_03987 [Pyrenophora teres f. maculata]